MADMIPIARSPIAPAPPVRVQHGWEVSARRSDAPLTVTDCTPLGKILVRASQRHSGRVLAEARVNRTTSHVDDSDARPFEVPHGRAVRGVHGTLVVGSGPGEWLLLSPPETAASVADRVDVPNDIALFTVLDDTHGQALMRISGLDADGVLAKICAVDLCEQVTPNGAAFRTSVARVVTDVVRDDRGDERSYLLGCERASGQYLFDVVLDAGDEFGIEIDGFVWPGI